jgi:hypothetical protein
MGAKNLESTIAFRGGLRKRAPPLQGRRRRPNLLEIQPEREAPPNNSKENQIKILAFPWIPLVELRLINELWPKKSKNHGPADLASSVADKMSERTPFCLRGGCSTRLDP